MQRFIKPIVLLVVCIIFFSLNNCKKKLNLEKEPNNSFSSATDITLDKPIFGYFNSTRDRDFYRLAISEESILHFELTGIKSVNHAIQIWKGSSKPRMIKLIDDRRKSSPEIFANLSVKSGTYYICVRHGVGFGDRKKANKETPYKLTISSKNFDNQEQEPNDTAAQANDIEISKEISGFFSPAKNRQNQSEESPNREEDWYKIHIDLEDDKPKLLNASLSTVPGINSVLYLYDRKQKLIYKIDKNGTGQPEELSKVGIKKSGDYFLMVTTKNYSDNPSTNYNLLVSLSDHNASNELEVNDSFTKANLLVKNEIHGKIDKNDDKDYFKFKTSNSNQIFRIEAVPSADSDITVTIFNSHKKKVAFINNGRAGGKEIHPNLQLGKTFYIRIAPRLSITSKENYYDLSVTALEDLKYGEIEPNDSQKQAMELKEQVTGFISKRKDTDYYLIIADSFVKKMITIRGVRRGKISVSITDPMGNILKQRTIKGGRKIKMQEMINKKGYIIIKAIKENYANPYTITVRE